MDLSQLVDRLEQACPELRWRVLRTGRAGIVAPIADGLALLVTTWFNQCVIALVVKSVDPEINTQHLCLGLSDGVPHCVNCVWLRLIDLEALPGVAARALQAVGRNRLAFEQPPAVA
jgi:hypothetical protein